MSSYEASSSSSSEDLAVNTALPPRNPVGRMTQAGKTPRRTKKQTHVFEKEVANERVEQSERPMLSGVTDFVMGVNLGSEAGLSEGPYKSGLTNVLDNVTLQSNARGHRTEGGDGSSGIPPSLKQGFETRLQGLNTRKTNGGKCLPAMQRSSRTTVIPGKRLPGTAAHIRDLPRSTTSVKNLAGLTVYAGKFIPSQQPLAKMTNPGADFVNPPTNSQELPIAQLAAGLVPRPVTKKNAPLVPGSVREHLIPSMDAHWSVRTMQGRSSRAGVEELLRKFGENPEDPRLKTMKTKELYEYAGEMQKRCKALKVVMKQAAETALGPSALRSVPLVDEGHVSDDESAAGPSSRDRQPDSAAFSTKRAREDEDEEEDEGPIIHRRAKRAKLLSAKAKGKQPVKAAAHVGVESEVKESTSLALSRVKDALEAIKNVTLQDLARPALPEDSNNDTEASSDRATEGEQMTIIFDPQYKPRLSLAAQKLVRPIMRRRSEIVEVYQRWCELGQAAPTQEKSPYLFYHFGVFKADMEKLREELVRIVGGEGVGGNVAVRRLLNDVFAGDIEYGRI